MCLHDAFSSDGGREGEAACAFWKFRCGFAMKPTHREEEGGEGPHKCQTSLDTRWILSACDPLHACRRKYFWTNSPLVEFQGSNSTMDSNITDLIEDFMESALAQWVCQSPFVSLRGKSDHLIETHHLFIQLKPVKETSKTGGTKFLLLCRPTAK